MKNERQAGHLLFIDGEPNWLDFVSTTLSNTGYYIDIATSVEEGYRRTQNEAFDLILVESKKAEREKESLRGLARLQTERGHRLIVLFPTGLTQEKAKAMFQLGVHDCVDKPYDQPEALGLVNKQLAGAVLIVDDDVYWRERLVSYLREESYVSEVASDLSTAMSMLEKKVFDVVVLDLRLIEEGEGFEGVTLLQKMRGEYKDVAVIVVSAYGTVDHVKEGFKVYGISDYLPKQRFDPDEYRQAIGEAIRQRRARR
ncbi:MAG: response regulator [Chloroflexi bacterium]|nr:response regulator [Chloroflexota bacterium]